MPRSRLFLAVAVAVAALVAAGCGGSKDSSSTTPTAQWADGLCTAITTWQSAISDVATSLKGGNLTKDSLSSAANDVKSATETFTSDLGKLGKPDTAAGQQAQDSVSQLKTDIEADVKSIQDTVDAASGITGILKAVPSITATVSSAGSQISSTVTTLKGLDAKGELKSAFQQSSSCASLNK
jgi:hypothetical protein